MSSTTPLLSEKNDAQVSNQVMMKSTTGGNAFVGNFQEKTGLPAPREVLSSSSSQPMSVQQEIPGHQSSCTSCGGGCRDWIFALLFVIGVAGFAAVVGISSGRAIDPENIFGLECYVSSGNCLQITSTDIFHIFVIASICAGVSLVLSGIATSLSFISPKWTGLISIIIVCLYAIGVSVWGFSQGSYVAGVVGIMLLLVELWTLYCFFRFIAFAEALVGAVRQASSDFKGMYVVGVGTAVSLAAWTLGWSIAFFHSIPVWSGAVAWVILTFMIFIFYWVSETIKNIGHVSVTGSVAHHYFVGAGVTRNPTMASFVRACTLSFGSIALGSMIIAILQTLRRLFEILRFRGSRDWRLILISCFARVILIVIEALLRFFNVYVFTLISIYGLSYCEAAKKTKTMFGQHGFEMVMQNNVVASIIVAVTLVTMGACGGIAYALAVPAGLAPNHYWLVIVAGVLVGVFLVDGCFITLYSGSVSVLVCYFCEPQVVRTRQPELAQLLDQSHAQIVNSAAQAAAGRR